MIKIAQLLAFSAALLGLASCCCNDVDDPQLKPVGPFEPLPQVHYTK